MPRSNLRHAAVAALLGLLASASVAEGQDFYSIPANARVRVDFTAADRSRFERIGIGRSQAQSVAGTVEAVRADTLMLVVRSGTEPLRIPRTAVSSVYLSEGRPPRWRAALGGAVGPAFVAAALAAAATNIHRRPGDPSPSEAAAASALWMGASGALVAAWRPKERWEPILKPSPNTR